MEGFAPLFRRSSQIAAFRRSTAIPSGHRDLKPGNLFVVPDNEAPGGERVKILDFGIAKFFGTSDGQTPAGEEPRHLTTVGKLLGTPVYMSPEQCSGSDQINDRVDVYALGVILYQMIAGRLPFEAAAACVVMTKHLMEQPPALAELVPDLPPEIAELVHEMLGKSGPERPPMSQVTCRLEEILGNTQGARTGDWRSLHGQLSAKPRRTNRTGTWVAAAFVVSSVCLLGLGAYRRTHKPLPRPAAVAQLAPPVVAPQPVAPANAVPTPVAPTAPAPATSPTPTQLAAVATKKPGTEGAEDNTHGRKRASARPSRKGAAQPAGGGQPTASAPAGSGPDIPVFR